jgi:eukaryotic-like serine/threonine-protein kinase
VASFPPRRHFVYFVRSTVREHQGIYLASLVSSDKRRLIANGFNAMYSPPGYLLYTRDGELVAQPFDSRRMAISGEPVPIADVESDGVSHAKFSVSPSVLLYRKRGGSRTQLGWYDRNGKRLASIYEGDDTSSPALSPDEKRLAVTRIDAATRVGDVWLFELTRNALARLTLHPAYDLVPIWSPDGKRIVFASNRNGPLDLYQIPANGTGPEEPLLQSAERKLPTDWSSDGELILYENQDPKTKRDLLILRLSDRKPTPFLQTEFNEAEGQFFPGVQRRPSWIAYTSDETGRNEIYITSFPTGAGKSLISTRGGSLPQWRGDGKELFYVTPENELMAVEVRTVTSAAGTALTTGQVRRVFPTYLARPERQYAVSADGQRFLIYTTGGEATSSPIFAVVHWTANLKR